jgi:opacity protein-like surface antigen
MRNKFKLRYAGLFCAAAALVCASSGARAEEPWHDYSLRAFGGYVDNAATIDARDTYMKLKLGSGAEFGAAFSVALNRCVDIDMDLSYLRADGTQRNSPGSGNENNTLDIDMSIARLGLTAKFRYNRHEGMLVPWIGCGVNGALISSDENENLYASGGYIVESRSETSSSFGLHAAAGLDLYPVRTFSLAVTLEARYRIDLATGGPFKGDLDGAAFLMGLKWDFWPGTSYKFGS